MAGTTTHSLKIEDLQNLFKESCLLEEYNDTLLFLCSKKRLVLRRCQDREDRRHHLESDVEEDEKTAKAVLEDQQEFKQLFDQLKIWRIINDTLLFLCSKKRLVQHRV